MTLTDFVPDVVVRFTCNASPIRRLIALRLFGGGLRTEVGSACVRGVAGHNISPRPGVAKLYRHIRRSRLELQQ